MVETYSFAVCFFSADPYPFIYTSPSLVYKPETIILPFAINFFEYFSY